MDIGQIIVQYGVAGAVLVALLFFLRFLSEERKARSEERQRESEDRAAERAAAQEERKRFLDCLENYRITTDLIIERCTGKRKDVG